MFMSLCLGRYDGASCEASRKLGWAFGSLTQLIHLSAEASTGTIATGIAGVSRDCGEIGEMPLVLRAAF